MVILVPGRRSSGQMAYWHPQQSASPLILLPIGQRHYVGRCICPTTAIQVPFDHICDQIILKAVYARIIHSIKLASLAFGCCRSTNAITTGRATSSIGLIKATTTVRTRNHIVCCSLRKAPSVHSFQLRAKRSIILPALALPSGTFSKSSKTKACSGFYASTKGILAVVKLTFPIPGAQLRNQRETLVFCFYGTPPSSKRE